VPRVGAGARGGPAVHRTAATSLVSVCGCSLPGTPVRGSSPLWGAWFWCRRPPPPRGGLLGPRTPTRWVGLPAVVTHERHRGGNSTPLDIPVIDWSGPVTEVAGRVGVAVHELPTRGAHPHPRTELEVGAVAAAAVVGLGRRPLASRRSRRRVFSLDRSRPITGTTMWRRSDSRRIAPVVKRTRPRSRWRALNRGNPTRRPPRRPCLAADQLRSAATRSAIPQA